MSPYPTSKLGRLYIFGMGGTISSGKTRNGYKPVFAIEQMVDEVLRTHPTLKDFIGDIRIKQLMNIDSSNMGPKGWARISRAFYTAIKEARDDNLTVGIVGTHGTDTMVHTGSSVSYMVENPGCPIVLTGSQRGWTEAGTDAKRNLYFSIRATLEPMGGVYVGFHNKLTRGTRTKKTETPETSTNFDIFKPTNVDYDGALIEDIFKLSSYALSRYNPSSKIKLDDRILPGSVKMIKLEPDDKHKEFDHIIEDGYRGVIIEAFGQGGAPIKNGSSVIPKIKELVKNNVLVFVTSQTGQAIDMERYEVGKKLLDAGARPGRDTNPEALYTKKMCGFGRYEDTKDVEKFIYTDIAGEIDEENTGEYETPIAEACILRGLADKRIRGQILGDIGLVRARN